MRILEGRIDAQHLRIRFCVHEAREAVAGVATNAWTQARICLVQHDSQRRMEWTKSGSTKIFSKSLQTGLMRYCRPGISLAGMRLGRIFTAVPMYLVEVLG